MRKLWVLSALLLLASLSASAETVKDCERKCLGAAKSEHCRLCCDERVVAASYKCYQRPLAHYSQCVNHADRDETACLHVKDENACRAAHAKAEEACHAAYVKESVPCRDTDTIDISKEKCDERWEQE